MIDGILSAAFIAATTLAAPPPSAGRFTTPAVAIETLFNTNARPADVFRLPADLPAGTHAVAVAARTEYGDVVSGRLALEVTG